jgi:interleukin-1 receptor-associated kinase 1
MYISSSIMDGLMRVVVDRADAETPRSPTKLRKTVSEGTLAVPKDVEEFRTMSAYGSLRLFTYDDLRQATGDFDPGRIVGEGGFGVVYRGFINGDGAAGKEVAVKELNPEGLQGDREWLTEVSYLGQYSHPNLVELIGYCCEDDHRLLVYEFMAKGSLEHHLFRRACTLSWTTRVAIALDVARGLAFLHGAERPIIYRDFKTSNILLDAVRLSVRRRSCMSSAPRGQFIIARPRGGGHYRNHI